jgi:hypothetical protein
VRILENDSDLIQHDLIEEIRIWNTELDSYLLIDPSTYFGHKKLWDFLN